MVLASKAFNFCSYKFQPEEKRIVFDYRIEFENRDSLSFTETIILPSVPNLEGKSEELIDNLLQSVHLILGTSYYKLYCPKIVTVSKPLSRDQADFWNQIYKTGMGEFYYQNNLDPADSPQFPYDEKLVKKSFTLPKSGKSLVGVGGGKDSIVAVELLKSEKIPVTGFVVETQKGAAIIDDVAREMGIELLKIKRFLDPKIFQPQPESYNGHVPISSVFAFLGLLSAVLYGYDYIVVANEYSSNFGNLEYKGITVNHQWSKSAEAERLIQDYTRQFITPGTVYYSLLRPFYEIRIVEIFSHYNKYFSYFSSCNQSFLVNKERPDSLWCGKCPKCAFIFLLLSAFLPKDELITIFGKNLFEDEGLLPTFGDLLGYGKVKPFDCVGTFDEAQAALYLAREKFAGSKVMETYLPRIEDPKKKVEIVFQAYTAPTVPSKFRFVGIKNIAVLGYGREGKVTEAYLQKEYPELKIGILDQSIDPNYLLDQKKYDLAVKTPGMPPHLVTIPYTTATNVTFAKIKESGNKIIGVSGSKGKSTTTSLVYEILKQAGKDVVLLGNIGIPMLSAMMEPIPKDRIFVLELSSYMLNDLDMSPNVAVVTNLFPEHMDWHGSEEAYYAAKRNIINFQDSDDYFVYNQNNGRSGEWAENARANIIPFADSIPLADNEIPLLGQHNRENIKAAIATAKIFNISDSDIAAAISKFKPLDHRLQPVGTFKGITFYDDAISTTPESTIAALKSVPNVQTIFLGGQDRGYDFGELEKVVKGLGIKNIVLFPDSGKRIFSDTAGLNLLETESMEDAVTFAYQNTPKGAVCLLSCASPSYSVWKDFEAKGNAFQEAVRKLADRG
ncbi:MAG TPA: UDP-N-acetylmuramoyl-L-alanine--D-glutamate ligase [bacterium]|nr:UDP-N-acetylmuramoyl-L-alanine--D-glutamate ligase [bacterium]